MTSSVCIVRKKKFHHGHFRKQVAIRGRTMGKIMLPVVLMYVAVRMAALMNPALKERGYGVLLHVDWDISADLLSYLLTAADQVHPWSAADQTIFFMPEFMTRAWMLLPVKSQAEVAKPEEFFLRPQLAEDRFPQERSLNVPAALRARLHAQEQAGRLVFTDGDHATSRATLHAVSGVEENSVSGVQLLPTPLSGFDDLKRTPHSHNFAVR